MRRLALRIEGKDLDGKPIHPENADPLTTFRVSAAYFEALAAVAAATGVP